MYLNPAVSARFTPAGCQGYYVGSSAGSQRSANHITDTRNVWIPTIQPKHLLCSRFAQVCLLRCSRFGSSSQDVLRIFSEIFWGWPLRNFLRNFLRSFLRNFSEVFWGACLAWGWPGKIFSGLILGVHNKHPPLRSRAETTSHMAPAASADPRTILEISGKSWRLFPAG